MWQRQLQPTLKQTIYRVGQCNNCGDCCIIWHNGQYQRCKWYNLKAEQHCMIYDTRPQVCRDFPRSPLDLEDKPLCSYYFVDEKGRRIDAFMDKRVRLRLVK